MKLIQSVFNRVAHRASGQVSQKAVALQKPLHPIQKVVYQDVTQHRTTLVVKDGTSLEYIVYSGAGLKELRDVMAHSGNSDIMAVRKALREQALARNSTYSNVLKEVKASLQPIERHPPRQAPQKLCEAAVSKKELESTGFSFPRLGAGNIPRNTSSKSLASSSAASTAPTSLQSSVVLEQAPRVSPHPKLPSPAAAVQQPFIPVTRLALRADGDEKPKAGGSIVSNIKAYFQTKGNVLRKAPPSKGSHPNGSQITYNEKRLETAITEWNNWQSLFNDAAKISLS